MLLQTIGHRIRKRRKNLELTQQALAYDAKVSLRFLSQLESGKGNISVQRLADVCMALGMSLSELFQGVGHHGKMILSLVGLRGAGKSTIGAALSRDLGIPFLELDHRISASANMTLSEIFDFGGAEYYHQLEGEVLESLFNSSESCILAVGGSIVSSVTNWERLLKYSRTVWLQASPEEHLRRVQSQGDLRPMIGHSDALGKLKQILSNREPLYSQADLHIHTEEYGMDGTVNMVCAFYRKPI